MGKCRAIPVLLAGVVFVLAAFLCADRLEGRDRFVLEDDRVVIAGDPASEDTGRSLQKAYPGIAAELEKMLGWKFVNRPLVLLVGERAAFERMSGSELIAAFAVPAEHLVVIGLPSVERQPYLLNETFQHELCHLLLHDHVGENLPKWLDEGICQWVSGSLGEILVGREGGLAGPVDLAWQAVPLSSLEESFPGGKRGLMAAYEESRSIVDHIVSRYGKAGLLSILDDLKHGETIDVAVRRSLGKPLSAVETEWREGLAGGRIWLIRLGEYLYDILFFLAAVVTAVGGMILVTRRKRERLEAMDDEEEDAEDVSGDEGEDEEGRDEER